MSSIFDKNFQDNVTTAGERDYYINLFSNDSDDEIISSRDGDHPLSKSPSSNGEQGICTLHIKERLPELDSEFDMKNDTDYHNEENSDMFLSSGGSMKFISIAEETSPTMSDNIPKDIEIQPFSEEEIDDFLRDKSKDLGNVRYCVQS